MNPDDILKTASEVGKGLTAVGISVPFTAIVKRMLGPAADEVAEMWKDQIRIYRYERQVKLLEKVEKIAKDAGFTPQAVPPKILFPLLEGASFEEDENLHDMWAALLANAASPEHAETVRPGFVAILKQLSPDEAVVLNVLHDELAHNTAHHGSIYWSLMETILARPEFTSEQVEICLNGLEAFRLIDGHADLTIDDDGVNIDRSENTEYSFTLRGRAFVSACRPPKPKS